MCIQNASQRYAFDFWDKIAKTDVMTIASLFKKGNIRGAEEKEVSLFGRSLVSFSRIKKAT